MLFKDLKPGNQFIFLGNDDIDDECVAVYVKLELPVYLAIDVNRHLKKLNDTEYIDDTNSITAHRPFTAITLNRGVLLRIPDDANVASLSN